MVLRGVCCREDVNGGLCVGLEHALSEEATDGATRADLEVAEVEERE